MNSVRSTSPSLKYQRFTKSGCKDVEIIKFEFVAKTQSFKLFCFLKREVLVKECLQHILGLDRGK